MTFDAVNGDLLTDGHVAPALVSEEIEWRRPSSLVHQQSKPFKMVASRWWTDGVAPIEVDAVITEPYHTIAIALGGTHLRLAVSGHTIHDGKVGAVALQISGPGQYTRATLRAGSEFLHLHVSEAFLMECSEQSGGRRSTGLVDLINLRSAYDTVIERLARYLLRAEALVGNLGSLYVEGIAVAIVSRLMAWRRVNRCYRRPVVKWQSIRIREGVKSAASSRWRHETKAHSDPIASGRPL
jgi:AraC family transcriptional regulator